MPGEGCHGYLIMYSLDMSTYQRISPKWDANLQYTLYMDYNPVLVNIWSDHECICPVSCD